MKRARLRALTHAVSGAMAVINGNGRNEKSPFKGIDTVLFHNVFLLLLISRNEKSPFKGIDTIRYLKELILLRSEVEMKRARLRALTHFGFPFEFIIVVDRVEMKRVRLRALTHLPGENTGVLRVSRNEKSPFKGIVLPVLHIKFRAGRRRKNYVIQNLNKYEIERTKL